MPLAPELSQAFHRQVPGVSLEYTSGISADRFAVRTMLEITDQVSLVMHPTELDRHKAIHGPYGVDQSARAVSDNQLQLFSLKAPPVKTVQKGLPVNPLLRGGHTEVDNLTTTISILGQGKQQNMLALESTTNRQIQTIKKQITNIIFIRKDGSWTDRINLGDSINASHVNGSPRITADGKYMFFVSAGQGRSWGIYWVSTSFIDRLRAEHLLDQ